jgi:hydrogenase nickel incorporation protein HypA/HybF
MHELSLAQNILEIVEQYVPHEQRPSVKSIRIKLGESSGVVADSLEFCFSAITVETGLHDALLAIERVPFRIACRTCNKSFSSELGLTLCPECGGSETDVCSGTEIQVVDIELYDSKLGL